MGYDVKAAVDKVTSLTAKDGKYSIKKVSECARSSPSYAKMHTMSGVNKKTQMHNICRVINEKMIQPLIIEVVSVHAELIEDLQQEIKRLNNELTGTEETAPKNEAEERYEQDIKNLLNHVLQVEKMEKQLANIKKMAASQNEKVFGSSIEEAGDEELSMDFNTKEMDLLEKIEKHGKNIEKQVEDAKHSLYWQASNGLYNKSIKNGTADKAPFPKEISKMKKKEFIAKVKQYMVYRPDQFSHILPEARRAMDDRSRRTGVHYDPGSWDEQDEKIRDEFKQQNDRLYKMFEITLHSKELTQAKAQYTFGLSGLRKTKGKCEEGDGLRILHFWLSNLSKVSTAEIEAVETDLQCLPMKFGTGGVQQIREAVSEAEDLLERGDEMECMVQYKTVLQICKVLMKKNPLFVRLHEEYLKATIVAERRNSIDDLRKLMGDIKEVCDKICCGAGDDTRSVKVNMGLRVFSCTLVTEETDKKDQNQKWIGSIKAEDKKRKREGNEPEWQGQGREFIQKARTYEKQQQEKIVNMAQEGPSCRKDKCMEKAFRHRKDRGGHIHESGLCFECFVDAVRDGKKDKPTGVQLKGGKKMVLKRGEDMKWSFKILAVKISEDTEEPIQRMLEQARAEEKGGEERVFHMFTQQRKKNIQEAVVESEGIFDLSDLVSEKDEEESHHVMSNVE